MSVVALVTIETAADAAVAAQPIADRPWIAHLVARLRQARSVSRVVVVAAPAHGAGLRGAVPCDVELVVAAEALTWAAHALPPESLVACLSVWQLFVDPARLDALVAVDRPVDTTVVRAVLEREPSMLLAGGAYVDVLTSRGVAATRLGGIVAGAIDVPAWPEPSELRLRYRDAEDAWWGVALQEALLASSQAGDLGAAEAVMASAGLWRLDVWPAQSALPPRAILTVRCQPASLAERLVRHLARVPHAAVDVMAPAHLAVETAALPGVRRVFAFDGAVFDLGSLDAATLAALREARYDLCVVPRRTACGRGFENVTPLGAASGAAVAVWMDLQGTTGQLAGLPGGWVAWGRAVPPWFEGATWRARARAALAAWDRPDAGPSPAELARRADAIADALTARMDECLACHALSDVADHGIELAPVFLYRQPGVAAALAVVTDLVRTGRPVARDVDRALTRWLEATLTVIADAPPGRRRAAAEVHVVREADRMAAALAAVHAAEAGSAAEWAGVETLRLAAGEPA